MKLKSGFLHDVFRMFSNASNVPRNFPETCPKLLRNFPETSPKLPRSAPYAGLLLVSSDGTYCIKAPSILKSNSKDAISRQACYPPNSDREGLRLYSLTCLLQSRTLFVASGCSAEQCTVSQWSLDHVVTSVSPEVHPKQRSAKILFVCALAQLDSLTSFQSRECVGKQ